MIMHAAEGESTKLRGTRYKENPQSSTRYSYPTTISFLESIIQTPTFPPTAPPSHIEHTTNMNIKRHLTESETHAMFNAYANTDGCPPTLLRSGRKLLQEYDAHELHTDSIFHIFVFNDCIMFTIFRACAWRVKKRGAFALKREQPMHRRSAILSYYAASTKESLKQTQRQSEVTEPRYQFVSLVRLDELLIDRRASPDESE